MAKARSKDSMRALAKLTEIVDGQPRIIGDPPLIVPIEEVASGVDKSEIEEFVRGAIRSYRRTLTADRRWLLENFRYAHAARKVVGVGSVGTRAWIVLMLGRDESDPLFLQLKEAQASVLEPFLGKSRLQQPRPARRRGPAADAGRQRHHARLDPPRRTADGVSRDFYMRQLWDGKGSAVVDAMDPKLMAMYAQLCGWSLAKAHARSGDAIAIAGYLGASDSFDRALAVFAEAYADQNERDYRAVQEAVASGRLVAETGLALGRRNAARGPRRCRPSRRAVRACASAAAPTPAGARGRGARAPGRPGARRGACSRVSIRRALVGVSAIHLASTSSESGSRALP